MSSRGKTSKVVDFADADDSDSEQEPEVKDSKTKTNGKTDAKGDAAVAKKKSRPKLVSYMYNTYDGPSCSHNSSDLSV